ncbi:MAG TPA: phosphoenolpyruvate--protein phosphotransferase [Chloroflexus aurantiacus]|uniref:Phosphoenolpyruvate-protein phosphotransferase n=2 Tax=Chloroflexus aurantiacus TaxID=1108 RepID=A9W9R4_CHLAA|nr:phosphoenolpyruvate-protein phosphotransferase [Chloroflexus aurantiacus J-10-fl]RMG46328.1 MAG: phosphoenolpyruvate--protein phosphotransferase [Chloroflexota bacterium]HBW66867.1 phosphoenolpyruvate--protein phosphotransferase [Chloroflexus aurantiacus]
MMSATLRGAGGAAGLALGPAYHWQRVSIPTDPPNEPPEAALARFHAAQHTAAHRLRALAERQRAAGLREADLFDAQALLVEDETLTDGVTALLLDGQPLIPAIQTVVRQMEEALAALDDDYLRERAADIAAVGVELLRALSGDHAPPPIPPGAIVIADDLTPAETVDLPHHVAGFATAGGGPTGHTIILARSRGVPAVVGLGEAILHIPAGTTLLLDGDAALVMVDPDEAALQAAQERMTAIQETRRRQAALRDLPGRLRDGRSIALWANIGRPAEARLARDNGAEGIGLFRTEFLFLDRSAPPDEDEQFAAYRAVITELPNRPIVIRTLDVGGDKPLPYLPLPPEANPFLGVRGVRLSMQRPDLFQVQLRALLRAAFYGDIWIMLPMVTTLADLVWGQEQMREAAAALAAAGIEHRADPPLGIMIETPAAAVLADQFARHAAFFSIGSNDLAQYTLAVDRGHPTLATQYRADDPAVWRMIDLAARAAQQAGIPIGICGELGGEPDAAVALAGLGLNELSMAPARIPVVKERLAQTSWAEAQAAAARMVQRVE